MEPFWHQLPQYSSLAPNNALHNPDASTRQCRMVGVCNGETYLETINLTTLKRFSLTALAAFPPSGLESLSRSPRPHVRYASSDASGYTTLSGSVGSESMSLPDTLPTEVTDTSEQSQKPTLRLFLNAPELPSNRAVLSALRWMHQNAETPLNGILSELPPNLDNMDFWAMVDTYQAALSLALRPFPHRLKHRILESITNSTPDAEMVTRLTAYLPIDDAAILRLINTIENRRRQRVYTQGDLDSINGAVIRDPELEGKVAEITRHRSLRWRLRNRDKRHAVAAVKTDDSPMDEAGGEAMQTIRRARSLGRTSRNLPGMDDGGGGRGERR